MRKITHTAVFLCLAVSAAAQPVIQRIVPMTSARSVKIEISLSSPVKRTVQLSADITSCTDSKTLWQGPLGPELTLNGDTTLSVQIGDIEARLWSPSTPELYDLRVRIGGEERVKRIGFRSFEMRGGRFLLNGQPIFLRGNAINPPNRGIPAQLEGSAEFARDYIRFLKGMNVNIIRIPDNQNWMDVCDQEGMMVFAGRYGRPRGGTPAAPPKDLDAAVKTYKESELGPFTSHPSMVIYVLSNEMPHEGAAGKAYDDFLQAAYERLVEWDPTRVYIGNAGYGMGRSADVYDVHRYWGWYYNTFLTFLNLRDGSKWQNPGREQAITFTECVGNYTGIDGRYNLCSRTKQPSSQKCWTGHTPQSEQAEDALRYQALVLKNVTEMFRRMRPQNGRLAGLMPFTILFHDWDGVESFAQMRPKPAAYQYGISYQPVLLSWEVWTSNVYAGKGFQAVAHVVNDDEGCRDLRDASVHWALEDINRMPVASGSYPLPEVKYYATHRTPVEVAIPAGTPTGRYTLHGSIMQAGKVISQNTAEVFVAGRTWENRFEAGRSLSLYDPKGMTRAAFDRLGVKYTPVSDVSALKSGGVLVIGESAWDGKLTARQGLLREYMDKGGRIVCLRQDRAGFPTQWLPVKVSMLEHSNNSMEYLSPSFAYCDGMNINMERPDHPLFRGIGREDLRLWSDYTGFDESKPGFPQIYPVTQGFDLAGADFEKVTVYADYSRGIAATALCEIAYGAGSVLLSGFDLAPRSGIDPVADRLLANIANYAVSAEQGEPYMYVDRPIDWGDFASEAGLVSLAHNGMMLNTVPVIPKDQRDELKVVVDAAGFWYAGAYGGWNTKPGVQYMPRGRRPFAPFEYTRGGNVIARGDNAAGKGFFLVRIPQGRTRMTTTVENPVDEQIRLSIGVNGQGEEYVLGPRAVTRLETALPAATLLKVELEGDRRCVLLRTEFK